MSEKTIYDVADDFIKSIQNFVPVIEDMANAIHDAVVNAFPSLFAFDWRRRLDETDSEYAQRLVQDDWLDNPDARWEYQKIVWGTPVRLIRKILGK